MSADRLPQRGLEIHLDSERRDVPRRLSAILGISGLFFIATIRARYGDAAACFAPLTRLQFAPQSRLCAPALPQGCADVPLPGIGRAL